MIFYRYDHVKKSEHFCIEIPAHHKQEETLSYRQLQMLLISDGVDISQLLSIHIQLSSTSAPSKLTPSDSLPSRARITLILRLSTIFKISEIISKFESLQSSYSERKLNNFTPLDISILYADPLIKKHGLQLKEYTKNLNFADQITKFEKAFSRTNLHPYKEINSASIESISRAMNYHSKILHISCHGRYDKETFVLVFESSKMLGLRQEITAEQLFSLVKTHSHFKIVVLSACYSDAMGDALMEAGVNCLISVHEKWEILEDTATLFSEIFYENLFKANTIEQSYKQAKERIRENQSKVPICCCRHLHKDWCSWNKSNCSEHLPVPCKCPTKSNPNWHRENCTWALNFMKKYNCEVKIKNKGFVMCCCSPELPHEDCEKFMIRCSPRILTQKIFDNQRTKIREEEHWFKLAKSPIKILKRNLEIHHLLKLINSFRLIQITGKLKVGKSLFVKSAAFYAYERKVFRNGALYIDLEGVRLPKDFTKAMAFVVGCESSFSNICQKLHNLEVLIVLDNVDLIIQHSFVKKVQRLTESCSYCKVWVVSRNFFHIDSFKSYELPPLSENSIKMIFQKELGYASYQKYQRLFRGHIPIGQVQSIIQKVKNNEPFDIMTREESKESLPGDTYNQLNGIESKSKKLLRFMHILALFYKGIPMLYLRKIMSEMVIDFDKYLNMLRHYPVTITENFIQLSDNLCKMVIKDYFFEENFIYLLKFLCNLARSIVKKMLNIEPYHVSRCVKTLANFYPLKILLDLKSECESPSIYDDFPHSLKSFKEYFVKYIGMNILNKEVCEYVYELCEATVFIYLLKEKPAKAVKILDSCCIAMKKFNIKDFNENYYKLRLKSCAIQFVYNDQLIDSHNKIIKLVDIFVSKNMSDWEIEAYVVLSLILIQRSLVEKGNRLFSDIEYYIAKAKDMYKFQNNDLGIAKCMLIKGYYYFKFKTNKITIRFAKKLADMLPHLRERYGLETKCLIMLGTIYTKKELQDELRGMKHKEKWMVEHSKMYWKHALECARHLKDTKLEDEISTKLKNLP